MITLYGCNIIAIQVSFPVIMEKLPDEILMKIFSVLDVEAEIQVEFVCKRWQRCLLDTFNSVESLVVTTADYFKFILR